MVDIFTAVADETRRSLLELLLASYLDEANQAGELSVSELVQHTGLTQPTVSKQLKVLREAGLVAVRSEGQQRLYSLQSEPLEALEDWVIQFLSADFDLDSDAGFAADSLFEGEADSAEPLTSRMPEWPKPVLDAASGLGSVAAALQEKAVRAADFVGDRYDDARRFITGLKTKD